MSHGRYVRYTNATAPFYVVLWDLQWQVLQCWPIAPRGNVDAALSQAIERQRDIGWQPEHTANYDFVFIRNGEARRLLSLTTRDPYDLSLQSFDPFRGQAPTR